MARVGESLRPTYLPAGFRIANGSETDLGQMIEYTPPGGGDLPRVELMRSFTTDPPSAAIAHDAPMEQVTVHGTRAVLVAHQQPMGSAFSNVAWREREGVVIVVTGYKLARAELLKVAEGVAYEPGQPGPAYEWGPCPMLPEGALSRAAIMAQEPAGPGRSTTAKLVRSGDLRRLQPGLLECRNRGCDDDVLLWLVLVKGPPGSFMDTRLAEGPPFEWSLAVLSATTGRGVGAYSSGPGQPPAYFFALEDHAP